MRIPIKDRDERKLLVLIAAYADAGERSPRVQELARRTGISGRFQKRAARVDALLRSLEAAGHLRVHWRSVGDEAARERGTLRNRYELRLAGAEAVSHAPEREKPSVTQIGGGR